MVREREAPIAAPVTMEGAGPISAAMTTPSPSWRRPAAIAAILLLILFWAVLVASFSEAVGRWPVLVQALFYLVAGIVWIVPLKPLLRWSQTGRWGARSTRSD